MFQQFFSDTIESRFIKNLLSSEPLPMIDGVKDGDIIIEGCCYIYKKLIIKCVTTGALVETQEILYPGDTIYPSVILYPLTGHAVARYRVIAHYSSELYPLIHYKYRSTKHWYDEDTHYHLGVYLRWLRDVYDFDLMHLYNCYSSKEIYDVYLDSESYHIGENKTVKVVAVPIRFNTTYTVALNSDSEVITRACIYGTSGMVSRTPVDYYSDLPTLKNSINTYASCRFNKPFLFRIETVDKELYTRQKDLYLLIQLPVTHNTSIVVLEGDFVSPKTIKTPFGITTINETLIDLKQEVTIIKHRLNTLELEDPDNDIIPVLKNKLEEHRSQIATIEAGIKWFNSIPEHFTIYNLSLLSMSGNVSFAFSSRLIEGLLLNIISHIDTSSVNIERVQRALFIYDPEYRKQINNKNVVWGVWDKNIRPAILRIIAAQESDTYFRDQDGYINKDIEKFLFTKGVYKEIYS